MIVSFHPEARIEYFNELDYYTGIDFQLGDDLRKRTESATREISEFPFSYRLRDNSYRRFNLARFPLYIPYIIQGETLFFLAIAHNARHPDYWKERIS
jgi:toxin ParE1/3/4